MLKSKALWTLTLGVMTLQLVLASMIPLVEDEAYYALWSTVPSAGYYDHPPMVAWVIAAGVGLFGKSLLGVRVGFVLMGVLVTLMTWRIAIIYSGSNSTAWRAALWGKIMVPLAMFGFAATPDAPSVLFWTAALWALVEAQHSRNAHWWLAVGLFAGLGVLSKFTDLFFGFALVVWLLTSREGRAWLPRWQVWAGAAIGMAVLIPLVLWNMAHGWIGLERQFGRIGDLQGFSITGFAQFWASIILLITPLLFWQIYRSFLDRKVPAILVWINAPVVIYLTYHATGALAGGQWLLPIFPALAVIAALGSSGNGLSRWVAPVGLGLSAVTLIVGFWPWQVVMPGRNPMNQWRGWDGLTVEIREIAAQQGAEWIATDAYGLTGQMAWHMGPYFPVWSVTQPERYQFREPFPSNLCDAKGLFISRTDHKNGSPFFRDAKILPKLERKQNSEILMTYYLSLVSGVKTCSSKN